MESSNLNPSDPDEEARLESLLRNAAPKLLDDGFSARVMAVLPPARTTASFPWQRAGLCIGGALVGGAVVAFALGKQGPSATSAEIASALQNLGTALAPLDQSTVALGVGMVLVSLVFVYWRELSAKLPFQ
jgi:hypothetical protein